MAKILVLDSIGGASGDMLLGLLSGFGVDVAEIERFLHTVIPDAFSIEKVPAVSCGCSGTKLKIVIPGETAFHHHHEHEHHHDHEHHHEHPHARSWRDIRALLDAAAMPEAVRTMACKVFGMLAEAEGAIHGVPAEEVHFHEIGAVDSILDIVGCCFAYCKLGIDAVAPGVLPTGSGSFQCAHGIYPLPAPATLAMLAAGNLAHCDGGETVEMLTPTGAALIAAWPKAARPAGGELLATSYSLGQREYAARPNLLRGRLYETAETRPSETLWQLESNLDDTTPEILAAAAEALLGAGALDVWQESIVMKKGRLAVKLCVLADEAHRAGLTELYFAHTSTFGVRAFPVDRVKLAVKFREVETPYGKIRIKEGWLNGKCVRRTPEYEDCRKTGSPLPDVYAAAIAAACR